MLLKLQTDNYEYLIIEPFTRIYHNILTRGLPEINRIAEWDFVRFCELLDVGFGWARGLWITDFLWFSRGNLLLF